MTPEEHHHDDACCHTLPVRVCSMSAVYCSSHHAYTLYASVTVQSAEDVELVHRAHWNGGPFDQPADVRAAAEELVTDLLRFL